MAYPLRFPEKAPKGTKQGAKLPDVLIQGREIGVFLAFSRFPARITRIEQDLRRRTLYPGELRGRIVSVILPKKCLSVKNNRQLFALCAYTAWYRAKKEGIRCENVTITVWILRTFCMTKRKAVPVSGKIPG